MYCCRPHSSQSACVRPSRLYRHSAHLGHRLSQAGARLVPVPPPLSPVAGPGEDRRLASPLSPTASTVSSLLSLPVFPRSQSDTSSVSAAYSDRDR